MSRRVGVQPHLNARSQTSESLPTKKRRRITVEFLVEFEINVPEGTPESEVKERENAEAVAAAKLVDDGHLVRLWKLPVTYGDTKVLGLYRARGEAELHAILAA